MFGQTPEEAFRRRAAEAYPDDLHRRDENQIAHNNRDDNGHDQGKEDDVEQSGDTTQIPSPEVESIADGTWGERDIGGPVSQRLAMQDFDQLTTRLSITQSRASRATGTTQKSNARRGSFFHRMASRVSGKSERRPGTSGPPDGDEDDEDAEEQADDQASSAHEQDDFHLENFMRDGHLEPRTASGESTKKVGVVFKNLSVKGVASGTSFVRSLPEAVLGTFGPDLYRLLSNWFPVLRFGHQTAELRTLINDFTGVVRHGEMMLVLGRPGSGCSTFLRVIANNRGSYAAVEGEVSYSGISAEEADKHYRGEVVYNGEDDQHMPTLTVGQTLKFSLLNKTKKHLRDDLGLISDALLRMFAIKHTENTLVGSAYVRGVSGGERKRVSIAETLATKSTVACWDNSTRGLDASTALDYARSLRIMTDVSDRTTITTLYQAGEGIYELMDKVLVIDEGRMLYQGPAKEARQYFEDLGFFAPTRQTTADFLTSICDPSIRQFREGYKDRCPKTAAEIEKAFRESPAYQKLLADVKDFEQHLEKTGHADAKTFQATVQEQKSRRVATRSNYTVSFWKQVLACTRREFWLLWGNKTELYTKYFIVISMGFVVSSLFYNTPETTAGAFLRGGVAFFSIIFLGWLQLAELMKAVSGRVIVARHKEYAFYRPSAVNLARALTDIPVLMAQVIIFGVIMYFMTNLALEPGKFFIYLLFIYVTTFCFTALYRMFAALSPTIDDAVRFSGVALNLLIIYTGYVVAKPVLLSQKIWFGWIFYINPAAYAFEAVLTNEFHGRIMQCAPEQLVPQGPGILPENQGCALPGSQPGRNSISGDDYLGVQYDYTRAHLWRNFGVVVAFSVLYLLVTVIATEMFSFVGSGAGALVFKKSKKSKKLIKVAGKPDEEKGASSGESSAGALSAQRTQDEVLGSLAKSEKVFTWENVSYTVPTPQGPKQLLNKINGYAKPGVMVALMGASGAGKTTLLNTLSQRQTVGVVSGDMLVDGKVLGNEFQRSTGFVEQMDLHDETATIREALEFSALLRQSRETPRHEKLEYVDKIIDLLELQDIQDAIIASLGVEQKKRLTIGVELAAKPSLLLFLDEPTSGLDSQSAFSIVRFLRKLCAAGQAVVCTIHQPSSDLIQEFDKILALNPGGNVFYFGPVGNNGSAVIDYFAERGVHCPPGKNVAEFILETAAKGGRRPDGTRINWNREWRNSAQNKELVDEIQRIKAERGKLQDSAETIAGQHEFAAPVTAQITHLTKRMFIHQWRDPSYMYSRLFVSVIVGIFNGFTFWKLGNSVADMQNRMFTLFLIIMIPATVLNSVVPKFYINRALWEAREHPSRIYGWVAFCTAEILSEIPGSIVAGTVYWLLWYLPTGLPTDAPAAGYVYLMTLLFYLFQASWGQWITAWSPNFTVISNVLPFFLVIFSLFNGVVVPYNQFNVFWKYWLYYLNPSTYYIAGVLSATLISQPVVCADSEAAYFNPPSGQTCLDFAGAFVRQVGQGYLIDPNSTTNCGYCPYGSGNEYLTALNVKPSDKWRNFGIFLAFCVSNWA
ncbi:ABC-2 type transporter-domain-containing protein [Lasiosphaeria miniovina]|uniref:ABC-2 type transporter-domain-containing protein n=1 Tax=Lasiosphaeria miniovina TaxID=1954250 RepID=A0AA40E7G9_9PEZI|nr:ABC-2 type transporter-domain-containing protein [Lasiosphaeria miniovina]KAK0726846.1 ABC-2 type transporter-domain-containing protein [Lasiosphaeria miniovina]